MKLICSKENLADGINIVQKAVPSKTTLPILEGLLLDASKKFRLTGNDLEIGIECTVEADIQEQGSIVINSRIFGDIIRKMPDSEVLIEVKDGDVVIIECENSHFEIKGMQASGFPRIPDIKKENALKISQKIIREMIRQTLFAVSIDENRYILRGSLFECKDNNLTIVSVDGFRLALRKFDLEGDIKEFSVVIPGKTLNEILKILEPVDDEISIYSSSNQIMFDIGRCKIVSRLLEGEFLNYRSVIPEEYETKVRINAKDMLESIERAYLITMGEKRYPVIFNIVDDKVIITAKTNIGSVREEIRVEMEGGKLDIAFNPIYFIEALKAIEDEHIDIFFTTSVGQCIIRPISGDRYVYLIVPVRFKNE